MEKAKSVKEFVERIDAQKKKNPKDMLFPRDVDFGSLISSRLSISIIKIITQFL